jgi:hypothetical protein
MGIITQLHNALQREVVVIEIRHDPVDVAEIFSRLNSAGTRVSEGDIAPALIAVRQEGWVREELLPYIEDLKEHGFEFDPSFLIRSMTAVRRGSSRLRDVPREFWEVSPDFTEGWERTKKAVNNVIRVLKQLGVLSVAILPARNALIPMFVLDDLYIKGDCHGYEFAFDPTRPEGLLARSRVDDTLQRAWGRKDPLPTTNVEVNEPGGRYIDFLIPGLVGMSLMGGGLWGVGFAIVDMRIRKVLKRLLTTPMGKTDFLGAILISRLLFLIPEVLVLLLFARFAFGVVIQGSLLALGVIILLGAVCFAGIGLLVASRARTLETVSGLMNLVMLPMWILSGIFFSSERFPEVAQPFIQALPLTPLINALRSVSLEGATLLSQWPQLAVLAAWGRRCRRLDPPPLHRPRQDGHPVDPAPSPAANPSCPAPGFDTRSLLGLPHL